MIKAFMFLSLTALLLFSASSCKKTTENELVNGLWQVNSINVDTASGNYLDFLPNYAGCNNCAYKLSFEDPNILIGYYISNDSIVRLTNGTFNVPNYTQVYIKVDNFLDGTFDIARPTLNHWVLTCQHNHVAAFDNGVNPLFDTTYTKVDMTKL